MSAAPLSNEGMERRATAAEREPAAEVEPNATAADALDSAGGASGSEPSQGSSALRKQLKDTHTAYLNLVPLSLLTLYFLNSFALSFPDTAQLDFVIYTLKMELDVQNYYWVVAFAPYTMKPCYAMLSTYLPLFGYRRKSYIIVGALGAAASAVAMATVVKTSAAMFACAFFGNTCYAMWEFQLGAFLVDVVHRNKKNAGALQGTVTGIRYAATVLAYLVGLPFYGCTNVLRMSASDVFFVNAIFPLLAVFVAWFFLSEKSARSTRGDAGQLRRQSMRTALLRNTIGVPNPSAHPKLDRQGELPGPQASSAAATASDGGRRHAKALSQPIILILVIMQALIIWASFKDVMPNRLWPLWLSLFIVLGTLLGAAGVYFVARFHYVRRSRRRLRQFMEQESEEGTESVRLLVSDDEVAEMAASSAAFAVEVAVLPAALFLFLLSSMPVTTTATYNLSFHIFTQDHECRIQTLSIVSAASRALAAAWYGYSCNNRRLTPLFFITAVAASTVSLLRLPLTTIEPLESIDLAFWYSVLVSILESAMLQIAFLPGIVLAATKASELGGYRDIAYGILLASLDFGDTTGGWLSAFVTRKLGVTTTNFENLPALYAVCGVAKPAAVLVGLPLLLVSRRGANY